MKSSINNASARQHSGGLSTTPYRGGDRSNRRRSADIADVEREIAELVDRSTEDLRVRWRQLHRTEPPPGLSRDLIIRALAHQLQEGSYGEASRALRRRLQSLSAEFEKGAPCRDFRIGLKAGTTLVRQWRGHAYTVLVREDGFEYEGRQLPPGMVCIVAENPGFSSNGRETRRETDCLLEGDGFEITVRDRGS